MAILNETMPPRRVLLQSAYGLLRAAAYASSLGMAFGLGLWVSDGEEAPSSAHGSPLQAADDSTAKLASIREDLQMKFHDELTGKPRAAPAGPSLLQRAREPKSGELRDDVKTSPAGAPRAEESSSGTVPTEPSVAREPQEDTPTTPQHGKELAPDEREEMIGSPPDSETPDDRTTAARSLAASSLGVVSRPFTVQVASTPAEDGAASIASRLREDGHAARVVSAHVEGKGTVYRVRVGTFTTREEAERTRSKLRQGFVLEEESR